MPKTMYLWQTPKLGVQLRDATLTDQQRRLYFVIFAVGFLPRIELGVWNIPIIDKPYTWAYSIAFALIVLIGALKCFDAKGENKTNNFFERFVCLSVPLGIKLAVFEVVTKVLAIQVVISLLGEPNHSWSAYEPLFEQEGVRSAALIMFATTSVISLGFIAAFFVRMRTHLYYSGQVANSI